ncbi:ATP-binding protein [Niallia sp. Krafla_26]|uniref:ATP-binding protein n=1 Tax=Niallia sp. Krafla_26 TaxID=3064703 RepID=UPI003D181BE7
MVTECKTLNIDFHQLIENSASATILLDGNSIIYANKAMGKLLNKDHTKLVGTYFYYLHPDYHTVCEEKYKEVIETQESTPLCEQKLILDNGEIVDVEVTAVPFPFHGRTIIQANYRDITARKMTERRLIQSEKLSVLGELATGIVHEIKNPLTSIKGFLQLMLETRPDPDFLEIIKDEVERIEEIANELLFFSKPKEEQFTEQKITPIVKDAVFLFENEASNRNIKINVNAEDENFVVMGKRNHLKQVMINLIKNGIEAIEKDGHITINIYQNCNQSICIDVKDNGKGIPKEKLINLGQSFFSTKEKGTGLGLMVTFNIIKNHKGFVKVDSELNKGTTFTIELPQSNKKR